MDHKSLYEVLHLNDEGQPALPELPVEIEPEEITARSFCRGILSSHEYRLSIERRIFLNELPAAVECLLYHYAYGKPTERVEHTGKNGDPIVTEVRRVIVRAEPRDFEEESVPTRPATTH
jgi:hypothetical protein